MEIKQYISERGFWEEIADVLCFSFFLNFILKTSISYAKVKPTQWQGISRWHLSYSTSMISTALAGNLSYPETVGNLCTYWYKSLH